MAKVTVVIAALLILIGCVGYFGTPTAEPSSPENNAAETADAAPAAPSKRSVTALIPAFVGAILLVCGLLSFNEGMRKHAMHAAVSVGLLGFLAGAGRGAMGLGKFFSGDPSLNTRSFLFVWLMAILCLVFVVMCVNSFIQARKRREAAGN